jgi:hypothetical protein
MNYIYIGGNMETRENQKVITTMKAMCDSDHYYSTVNIDAASRAMTLLKPNTFKLWFYLGKNQNNYTFALSKVDAMRFCNISRSTYLAGINELIEYGYLVQDKNGTNHYNFYEMPIEEEMIITVNKNA